MQSYQEKEEALRYADLESDSRSFFESKNCFMVFAMSSELSGSKYKPEVLRSSGAEELLEQAIGRPAAIASVRVWPKLSQVEENKNKSELISS